MVSRVGDPGEKKFILKLLEADCLLEGKLHPSIRERLERVRELPARRVANLHGVERDGDLTYLVWDYVEGVSWGEYVKREDVKRDGALGRPGGLGRELVLAVRALHATGIVHGAIHEGNVLVDARGEVWLIDVSPLLWVEEREDARGIVELLAIEGVDVETVTMAELDRRVFGRVDENEGESAEGESQRWKSVLWAGIAVAIGIATAVGIVWAVN